MMAGMARDTRQRILEAAERVIREHGLVGATTRLIAKEAGCAEGTLYVHFPDRQELLLAILDEKLPSLKDPLMSLGKRVGRRSVRRNLVDVARAATVFYQSIIPVFGALFGEPGLLRAHQGVLRQQRRGPQRGVEAVVEYLRAEQGLGRVAPDADLVSAALIVLGGTFFQAFVREFTGEPRSERDEERVARSMSRAAWRMLAPRRKAVAVEELRTSGRASG